MANEALEFARRSLRHIKCGIAFSIRCATYVLCYGFVIAASLFSVFVIAMCLYNLGVMGVIAVAGLVALVIVAAFAIARIVAWAFDTSCRL